MESSIQKLMNVAVKVRTPLSLAGLMLVVLYGIYKEVLSLPVFEKIDGNSTFLLLQNILNKIFWLALLALILGVLSYVFTIFLAHRRQTLPSHISHNEANLDSQDSQYEQISGDEKKKFRHPRQL